MALAVFGFLPGNGLAIDRIEESMPEKGKDEFRARQKNEQDLGFMVRNTIVFLKPCAASFPWLSWDFSMKAGIADSSGIWLEGHHLALLATGGYS